MACRSKPLAPIARCTSFSIKPALAPTAPLKARFPMLDHSNNLHPCTAGGTEYLFRAPTVYDSAKMRRLLARQRVRRPALVELRVAAMAGVAAMADAAGEPQEGLRQKELVEDWYRLLEETNENDIDEPDFEKRAAELTALETERKKKLAEIYPQIAAIEANLERHHTPYAELIADQGYWDDVSRIEIVRLLLLCRDKVTMGRDEEDMLTEIEYQSIPKNHRMQLATFAFRLMAPDESQRKN